MKSELREMEFVFRLDGDQTATVIAALRASQEIVDNPAVDEVEALLTEQFKAQN